MKNLPYNMKAYMLIFLFTCLFWVGMALLIERALRIEDENLSCADMPLDQAGYAECVSEF